MFLVIATIAGLCLQVFGNGKAKPTEWFKKDETVQTVSCDGENETAVVYTSAVSATSENVNTIPRIMVSETYTLTDGVLFNRFTEVVKNHSYDGFIYSVVVTPDSSEFQGEGGSDGAVYSAYAQDRTLDGMNETILLGAKKMHGTYDETVVGYATWGNYNGLGWEYYTTVYFDPAHVASNYSYSYIDELGFTITEKELSLVFKYGEYKATESFQSNSAEYKSFYNLLVSGKLTSFFGNAREYVGFYTVYSLTAPPLNDGQVFYGWYYDSAFTRPYDGQPIDKYASIYPKVDSMRFSVEFDSSCETEVESQTVDWGTVLNPTTLTLDGHTFLGWFLSDGTQYKNQPIKQDTKLTAHWEVHVFTVTFYVDDDVYCTESAEYGTAFLDIVDVASAKNLQITSLSMSDGTPINSSVDEMKVSGDLDVIAVEMNDMDKVINTVKNNTPLIVGGVIGGIALIALIVFIFSRFKRRNKGVKRTKRM